MLTTKDAHQRMFEIVKSRDWTQGRDLLHPDYTYTGGDGHEAKGPDAGIEIAQTYTSAFPDLQIDVQAVHTSGDVAVAEIVVTGTHQGDLKGIAPTGRRIRLPLVNIVELRDGKIYREREYFDSLAMLQQLGVAPQPIQA